MNSFERDGFVYDGGIRAMENSGVLFPMLRHLGLEIEFVANPISIGIEDQIIPVESEASLGDYQRLLEALYPESRSEIAAISDQIRLIMNYMKVQYGINNPDLPGHAARSGIHAESGAALDGAVCHHRPQDW